jgi:hypothetical protein
LIQILRATETLRELDLRGAQLKPDQLDQVIYAVTANDKIIEFTLNLSRMGLNGKKLAPVLESFRNNLHDKWTDLSFDENGMTVNDLLAIIEIFQGLKKLRGISIGANFDRKDKRLPDALLGLLGVPTLESLSLVGTKSSYLGEALLPLLGAIATNESILFFDDTGNRVGNAGAELIAKILTDNHTLTEIRFDGSRITDLDAFRTILEFLSTDKNERLHACPFPMSDCYELVQSLPKSQQSGVFDTLSDLQMSAQDRMQTNMALVGIHSELSKKGLDELNELLDNITLAIHEELDGVQVNEHAMLCSAFGLPLPHRNDLEDVGTAGDGSDATYDASTGTVREEAVVATDGLATLQFNSLCIRRPDARGQLARAEPPSVPPPKPKQQPSELAPAGDEEEDDAADAMQATPAPSALIPPSELVEEMAPSPMDFGELSD